MRSAPADVLGRLSCIFALAAYLLLPALHGAHGSAYDAATSSDAATCGEHQHPQPDGAPGGVPHDESDCPICHLAQVARTGLIPPASACPILVQAPAFVSLRLDPENGPQAVARADHRPRGPPGAFSAC